MRPTRVVLDEGAEGLAAMVHGLLSAAVEDPRKSDLLDRMRGTVAIRVPEAEVEVGLRFASGGVTVYDHTLDRSDVTLTMPAETLLSLPSVPLLLGLPSVLAPGGRDFAKQVLARRVRITGLRHLGLITGLNTLLSVA